MNANELADLYDAPYEYPEWGSKAQAMLRQLQARIKELQESERNLINHLNESDIEIEALKEQVEGLKEDTDRVMDKSSW